MRCRATAPCRADLAGGTLDIWPLGLLHPGAMTVNAALGLGVELELSLEAPAGTVRHSQGSEAVRTLAIADACRDLSAAVCFAVHPAGGVHINVRRQAPMGSGLGGSSTYGVALAAALAELTGTQLEPKRLVALVRDLEARILGVPTGTQDHWAAVCGGVLALHLEAGGERVQQLTVDRRWLDQRLAIFFTGITHHSGMVNWQVIRRRIEGDDRTTDAFTAIASAARDCREALLAHDEAGVAQAIRREWNARKQLAPEVCPPELQGLETTACDAGALAVKACGAGGGGSLLLWHRPEDRELIAGALRQAAPDSALLVTGVAEAGCKVELLED